MLIRATIENFLSFNSECQILLTPGKTRNLKHHIIRGEKVRDIDILKSSVLLGANASGKSNFIKAISFAKRMVVNGPKSSDSINYKKFRLDRKSSNQNSKIEIEFKINGEYYAYGFIFNKKEISEEWLYRFNKESEYRIFDRLTKKSGEVIVNTDGLNIDDQSSLRLGFIAVDTNVNELFIYASNNRNISNIKGIEPLTDTFLWFNDVLTVIFPGSKFIGMEVNIETDKQLKDVYKWFLTEFRTGISGLETKKVDFFSKEVELPEKVKGTINENLKIGERAIVSSFDDIRYSILKTKSGDLVAVKLMTTHKMKNENRFTKFEIKEESDGTQRIMDLIPALMELSKDNKVFLIDEIERSLHPNLVYKLFELFFNESSGIESQLICTSHESNLLNLKLFRKDEIWFVKKNRCGESRAYSLEEFKPRKDKDIRTGYLKGRYSAIPALTKMENAPWKDN
jgi:uncharacterized protein